MKPIDKMSDMIEVCLGWDAFRILIGSKPKRFTPDQVIEAIKMRVAAGVPKA